MASGGWAGAVDGMTRAEAHAYELWKTACWNAIRELARTRDYFTTDDVWKVLRTEHPDLTTHEPRAMGPMMVKAVKRGFVQKTKVARSSMRETSNTTDVWVYRSMLRGLPPEPAPGALARENRELREQIRVLIGERQLLADKLRRHEPESDLLLELAL